MPEVEVQTSHYVLFSLSTPIPTGPGGSISWTGSDAQIISASSRVNSGSDELLDVGVDWFNAANITYTGYTVEFGGQTFARRSASHRPPTCPGAPPPDAQGRCPAFSPAEAHRNLFERSLKTGARGA